MFYSRSKCFDDRIENIVIYFIFFKENLISLAKRNNLALVNHLLNSLMKSEKIEE